MCIIKGEFMPFPLSNEARSGWLSSATAVSGASLLTGIPLIAFSDSSCEGHDSALSCTGQGVGIGLVVVGALCMLPAIGCVVVVVAKKIFEQCHAVRREEDMPLMHV